MTCVVISQPMYFPWAGFLAQMALADIYIWLDDAQHSKGSFTNRIQVKMPGGRKWMSIPLAGQGAFQRIADLKPAGSEWRSAHSNLLAQSLRGQPQLHLAIEMFRSTMTTTQSLCDQLIAGAEAQAAHLRVLPPRILRSSQLEVGGAASERVLKLVQAVGGDCYLTGHGALAYLDHAAFNAAGIAVRYIDYDVRPWPQPFGDFSPYVTGLDLIAALDAETASARLNPASLDWRDFKARKEHHL